MSHILSYKQPSVTEITYTTMGQITNITKSHSQQTTSRPTSYLRTTNSRPTLNLFLTMVFIWATTLLSACSSKAEYDAQGTFEATEITVSSETMGKILCLDINEGDMVKGGVPVGLVDTLQLYLQSQQLQSELASTLASRPDFDAQAASLRQQIEGATINRDRVQRLLSEGAATQKQLDDLNTQLSSLQGQLRSLRSQTSNSTSALNERAAAIATQIESLQDKIKRSIITSPIDGVILTKIAEPGEVASYGTPLFKVADTGNMYLRAYFTSDQLADLQLGQKVKVIANYGADNTKEYEGTISFIASNSEFTPKTIQTQDSRANLVYAVKISVPNDGMLKIGLSGNVIL